MESLTEFELPLLDSDQWLEAIERTENAEPLPTPFEGLIPTFRKGRTITLGADTGTGKTAFGLQALKIVGDGGFRPCLITTEMSPKDMFERFHPQFRDETECKWWIKETGAHITQTYVDAAEVEKIMRKGFDFVVLDYIQELPHSSYEQLGHIVRRIGKLAPPTNTCLLMLSQVKRPDPLFPQPPGKHDFAETQAIEQVSAQLLRLYEPERGSMELWTVKNRFGPIFPEFSVRLNPRTITFEQV